MRAPSLCSALTNLSSLLLLVLIVGSIRSVHSQEERFIRAVGGDNVQFRIGDRDFEQGFCFVDDVGLWNQRYSSIAGMSNSTSNSSDILTGRIDVLDEVDCCAWCVVDSKCASFVWNEQECYLYEFAVTRHASTVKCDNCIVGAPVGYDRDSLLIYEDDQFYRYSTRSADTSTDRNPNFLGVVDAADFITHFVVAEDTHVKLTTCLEVDPESNRVAMLDTHIGLYKVRDSDGTLIYISRNDDCELCSVRNSSVGRPTQSMLDLVLESGTYLLHVEAGPTSSDGHFRYAILDADPPKPEWESLSCYDDPEAPTLLDVTEDPEWQLWRYFSEDTSGSLAVYYNFTLPVDYQVVVTTCIDRRGSATVRFNPMIRVFNQLPLSIVQLPLSPGDELAVNVVFDNDTQHDRTGGCTAEMAGEGFVEAYLEFDVPANSPRYVIVDGVNGASGGVDILVACSEGIPTVVPTEPTAVVTSTLAPAPGTSITENPTATPDSGVPESEISASATSDSGLSAGAIVGIVLGSVASVVAVGVFLYCLRRNHDAPPPAAEVPSEAQMAELRPHDDPPPYDHVEANAPPLPDADDERENIAAEEVAITVSVDKGTNSVLLVELDPDAPSDSETEPDFRVSDDRVWSKEKKQDFGDEKRGLDDGKNLDGSHKIVSLRKDTESLEATHSSADVPTSETPVLGGEDDESVAAAVDTSGEERGRRRSPSQTDSESSSEPASSLSASSADGEDGLLAKMSAVVLMRTLNADSDGETPTPMAKDTKRRGSMEGIPVPECVASSIQVRNNIHAAGEAGESDINPQERSRRKQVSSDKQPLLMSSVVDGEIEWETESETELEEDARDALWDSDGVDGWSDISEPAIIFEPGARAPNKAAAGDDELGEDGDHQQPPPPGRTISRHGKIVGAPLKVKVCGECGVSIHGVKNFAQHMKEAHGKKAGYACEVCGRVMRRRFNLKVHMRTHLGQHAHEFACRQCGESFVQRSNLKRHMLTNHEKPVKCPCCKARFVTKEAAHAHTVEAHPNAPRKKVRVRKIPEKKPTFACPCKQTFTTLDGLLRHSDGGECASGVKIKIDGDALIIPTIAAAAAEAPQPQEPLAASPEGAAASLPSSGNSVAGNSVSRSPSMETDAPTSTSPSPHHQQAAAASSSPRHQQAAAGSSLRRHPDGRAGGSLSSSRSPSSDAFDGSHHRPASSSNHLQVSNELPHTGHIPQRVEGEGFPSSSASFSAQEGLPSVAAGSHLNLNLYPSTHAASSGDVLGQSTLPLSELGTGLSSSAYQSQGALSVANDSTASGRTLSGDMRQYAHSPAHGDEGMPPARPFVSSSDMHIENGHFVGGSELALDSSAASLFPLNQPGALSPHTSSIPSMAGTYVAPSVHAGPAPGSPLSPQVQSHSHSHVSPVGSMLGAEQSMRDDGVHAPMPSSRPGNGNAADLSRDQIAHLLARLEQKTADAASAAERPGQPIFSEEDHMFLADLKRLVYGGAIGGATAAGTSAHVPAQAQTSAALPHHELHTFSVVPDLRTGSSGMDLSHSTVPAVQSMSMGASQSALSHQSQLHASVASHSASHEQTLKSAALFPLSTGPADALGPHRVHQNSSPFEAQQVNSFQASSLPLPANDLTAPLAHSSSISGGFAAPLSHSSAMSQAQPFGAMSQVSFAQYDPASAPVLVGGMSHPYVPSPLVPSTSSTPIMTHRSSLSLTSASLAPAGLAAPLYRTGSTSSLNAAHISSRRNSLSLTSASLVPPGVHDQGLVAIESSSAFDVSPHDEAEDSIDRRPKIGALPEFLAEDAFGDPLNRF